MIAGMAGLVPSVFPRIQRSSATVCASNFDFRNTAADFDFLIVRIAGRASAFPHGAAVS